MDSLVCIAGSSSRPASVISSWRGAQLIAVRRALPFYRLRHGVARCSATPPSDGGYRPLAQGCVGLRLETW